MIRPRNLVAGCELVKTALGNATLALDPWAIIHERLEVPIPAILPAIAKGASAAALHGVLLQP